MSFDKAIQKQEMTPELLEYTAAVLLYSEQSKRNSRVRRQLAGSSNPMDQYKLFLERQRYSKESKEFNAARDKWLQHKLQQRTGKITATEIVDVLKVEIPSTLNEILKEHDKINRGAMVSDEQFEQIASAAMKHMEERDARSTKEQFLSPFSARMKDDPTLDDSPLPE